MKNKRIEQFDNSNPASARASKTRIEPTSGTVQRSRDERVSLAPLDPATALKALLRTPPPSKRS